METRETETEENGRKRNGGGRRAWCTRERKIEEREMVDDGKRKKGDGVG